MSHEDSGGGASRGAESHPGEESSRGPEGGAESHNALGSSQSL